ncbi:MAG: RNA methyltransferase [Bacilli bacterium]|nr:RNA methyltransferase [Bacilli bacterium]
MIKEITSKENNKIKFASSLKMSKYRKENKQFLAEGKKSLELALKAGVVKEIFTTKKLPGIRDDIVQYLVDESLLKKISSTQNPEGVVFVSLMQEKKVKKLNKVIYLDHVNDPGNMGTIIRTALAFDYDAVVVSEGSVDVYNEKVVAASKGAIFLMPILFTPLVELKEGRTVVVSTLDDKSVELNKIKVEKPFVLVLGNEAHGVSEETIALADIKTKIHISNIESLNVSIAAGILMHHLQ